MLRCWSGGAARRRRRWEEEMASAALGSGTSCCCCWLRGAVGGALLNRWRVRRGNGGGERQMPTVAGEGEEAAGHDFLKFNDSQLQQLPCQTFDPIPLGEGPGIGMMKGVDSMAMPEGSTLSDLIQTGINYPHASVGVVVRLRKELSLVKDIPVLFAIDQYNNWFTFSEYQEPVTVRSCRPIHARELTTVNAFRSMIHSDMMVGAFSHSTAVGKLRQDLPDVPLDARVMFPRYTLDEAATVAHYYLRQKLVKRDKFSEEKWKKIYYLANGNGAEMRWLCPFI